MRSMLDGSEKSCRFSSCSCPKLGYTMSRSVQSVPVQSFGIAQHHHGIARGTHQVVALFHNATILAVVHPEFFKPIVQVLEHFEAACRPKSRLVNHDCANMRHKPAAYFRIYRPSSML